MKYLTHLFLLFLFSIAAFPQEKVVERKPEVHVDGKALKAKAEARAKLWQALQKARANNSHYGGIRVTPSDEALKELDAARGATNQQRYKVGTHVALGVTVDLEDEGLPSTRNNRNGGIGQMTLRGSDYVWSTSLVSENASAVRIHFTNFELMMGAAMYIYNDRGQAEGPYMGKGPGGTGSFWSNTIIGENIWIQIHMPGVTRAQDLAGNRFSINKISHLGEGFELARRMEKAHKESDCTINVPCVQNMSCYSTWTVVRKAVAKIIFEDNGTWICSGGLLHDNYSGDLKPWFLTAYHCIDNDNSASSIEALFQYTSDCGSCSASYVDSVLGATFWAGSTNSDFAFLELSELPISWGLFGWSTGAVNDNNGTTLYRISHPKGSPQSYSESAINNTTYSNSKWIYSDPTLGTTEKGSSGSPVFTSGGMVVGQLYGKTQKPNDYCNFDEPWQTLDGAFSSYWKSVRPYLNNRTGTYKMHVASANVSSIGSGSFGRNLITFKVVDELGHAVSNARVTVSVPDGSREGITNAKGEITITLAKFVSGGVCVSNITHDYFNTYDPASNTAECVKL